MMFGSGSTEVRRGAYPALDRIAEILIAEPPPAQSSRDTPTASVASSSTRNCRCSGPKRSGSISSGAASPNLDWPPKDAARAARWKTTARPRAARQTGASRSSCAETPPGREEGRIAGPVFDRLGAFVEPLTMPRNILVTNALPYANGDIHLGHLVGYIQADIWVRFQRMRGNTVHYVCADDTHGTPVMLRAEKEGVAPSS